MKTKKSRSLKLGILIIGGLGVLVAGVYLLGLQQNIFNAGISVKSIFKDVKGLEVGNKVLYSGIDVGNVSDITIKSDSVVVVEMTVTKEVTKFIREDAIVEIKTEGVLGNKLVTIGGGSTSASRIENGSTLRSRTSPDIGDILEEFSGIVKESREVVNNIKAVTANVKEGKGDLGRFINDTTIYYTFEKASKEVSSVIKNVNSITSKIDSGEGDLAILLNENKITTGAKNIMSTADSAMNVLNKASREIEKASIQINEGDGLLQMLLYDESLTYEVDTAVSKLDDGVRGVIDVAETVEGSWLFNIFSSNKDKKKKEQVNSKKEE